MRKTLNAPHLHTVRQFTRHAFFVIVVALLFSEAGADAQGQCTTIGIKGDNSVSGRFVLTASTKQNGCSERTTIVKAWIHDHNIDCTADEKNADGVCEDVSATDATTTANSVGFGYADGYTDHRYAQSGQNHFVDGGLKLLYSRSEDPEDPFGEQPCDYLPDGEPIWECESPILVPTGKNKKIRLTSAEEGVMFDIDGDGRPEQVAWTEAGSDIAFLALDRNGDGLINSGKELFGNNTVAGAFNGFDALASLHREANGGAITKGTISSEDPIFARLLLWTDANHNGVSEPNELLPASELVTDIGLSYDRHDFVDKHGNEFRYRGFVDMRTAPGRNKVKGPKEDAQRHVTIYDVFFRVMR